MRTCRTIAGADVVGHNAPARASRGCSLVWLGLASALLLSCGYSPHPIPGRQECSSRTQDCPEGYVCKSGYCWLAGSNSSAGGRGSTDPGGYVTAGSWHGYPWTSVAPNGSTISPADFSGHASNSPLCASGSVAPQADYGGWALVGVNLNQAQTVNAPANTVAPTGTGVTVNITNSGGSVLRVQISGPNGATDATDRWCAPITGTGGFIPWSSFSTTCWNTTGSTYSGQPIEQIAIVVPGGSTAAVPFNFCLNSFAQGTAGSTSTGGSTGTGGITGSPGTEYAPCQSDADCGANLGCDPQAVSVSDGYCTPLCNLPTDCSHQTNCPSMVDKDGDCKDLGNHKGMGYCDQYTGNNGPHTCASSGTGGTGGSSGGTATSGAPGTKCTSDADCNVGRCLGTVALGATKYCSPACTNTDPDCAEFFKNAGGFNIPLASKLQGSNNVWKSVSLTRGVTCNLVTNANVGSDDGKKYCWFACPANAAQERDSTGNIVGCACLPNFKSPSGSPNAVYNCQWDPSVQCSIFKSCPSSTSTAACPQDISCIVGSYLSGQCVSMMANIDACLQSAAAASCDGTCLANSCSGTVVTDSGNDPCVDLCCK